LLLFSQPFGLPSLLFFLSPASYEPSSPTPTRSKEKEVEEVDLVETGRRGKEGS
jgi:hypothetical protein